MGERSETSPLLNQKVDLVSISDQISPEEWARERFENNIRAGFAHLQNLNPSNPKIAELIVYGKTVEEKLGELRNPVGMARWQVELLMGRIPKGDKKSGFEAVILRLQRDTSYLDELGDVGISSALLNGLENGKFGAYVAVISPDTIIAKYIRDNLRALAAYFPLLDTVIIPHGVPTPEEMWTEMATNGKLPPLISYLDHELTHNTQWTKTRRFLAWSPTVAQLSIFLAIYQKYGFWPAMAFELSTMRFTEKLTENFSNDGILSEIHAFEAAASSPSFSETNMDQEEEITSLVPKFYGKRGKKKEEYVVAKRAYDLIHTLRILGLDDREIGREVSLAKRSGSTFPRLEERVKREKRKWISEEDLNDSLGKVLRARHELGLHLESHRAKEIATKELRRESGQWFI